MGRQGPGVAPQGAVRSSWLYRQKPTLLCSPTWIYLPTRGAPALTGSSPLHTNTWSISEQFCVPENAFFSFIEPKPSTVSFPFPLPLGPPSCAHGHPACPSTVFHRKGRNPHLDHHAGPPVGLPQASWVPSLGEKEPGGVLGVSSSGRGQPRVPSVRSLRPSWPLWAPRTGVRAGAPSSPSPSAEEPPPCFLPAASPSHGSSANRPAPVRTSDSAPPALGARRLGRGLCAALLRGPQSWTPPSPVPGGWPSPGTLVLPQQITRTPSVQ